MLTTAPRCNFPLGFPENTQSESYMLSLTECVLDFQNNALWDTHQHDLLTLNPVTGMIELHFERLVCLCLINLGLPADNCMSIVCKTLNVGCAIMCNLRNAMTCLDNNFGMV